MGLKNLTSEHVPATYILISFQASVCYLKYILLSVFMRLYTFTLLLSEETPVGRRVVCYVLT